MAAVGGAVIGGDYSIGWDVGGWNCERNRESRDALVILDAERRRIGTPWRGNLRATINGAAGMRGWIRGLFALCGLPAPPDHSRVVLAIDTPLGFSEAFKALVTRFEAAPGPGASQDNPYLYRAAEHYLFARGVKPLSPVKDMIGSQATKGMHVLARFAPRVERCGVWTHGADFTVIEAYPSPCRASPLVQGLLDDYAPRNGRDPSLRTWPPDLDDGDKRDALVCALIGHLFTHRPESLAQPPERIPASEGWIWLPQDALSPVGSPHDEQKD
ncbi:hypothetical protein [Thioalkalivibrio sulfidiphilus]|uniref:hypothetical protein n=1 Tax=Thioalkalivibrio sulfidiphilus TaxID=1033854 RepID=UPI000674BAED|nr:hypothetical protein [Thioalkalivibrio sulfidiphilus]